MNLGCEICRFVAGLLSPPPRYTVSQWADAERYLSKESSAMPGKYRSAVAPYQREPMDAVNDRAAQTVCLMFASQTGKTEVLNNIVGFFIASDPSPILVVQPTIELAESWSKERLMPMIRDTAALTGLVKESKSRDSGNTILHKVFPGGNVAMAGANAPSGLAGRPRRVVLLDEVDRYPASAGAEGDPCALAVRRTESFWNSVIVLTSTPTVKGISRIEKEYEQTDMRRWFCPCPHCGEVQHLKWGQVKWPKDKPEEAFYECEKCRQPWDDKQRLAAVRAGEWRATAPFNGKRGYHLNGIASPFKEKKGYRSRMHQMAAQFLEAKAGGRETLKTWTNTFLAETWEEESEKFDALPIMERCEDYGGTVPNGVLVLTAGVDVQGDRIEVEVVGHGEDEETWGLEKFVLYGNFDLPELQNRLDAALEKEYRRADGLPFRVIAAAIDTGHKTKSVYTFCRSRHSRRIYAVKGSPVVGAPTVTARFQKLSRMWLYTLGTDTLKDALFSRLRIEEVGARYCHFPKGSGYNEEHFKQLGAEEVRLKISHGQPRRVYVKVRERNEAIDLRVYALAALEILRPNMAALSKQIEPQKPAAVEYQLEPAPEHPAPPEKKISVLPRRSWRKTGHGWL